MSTRVRDAMMQRLQELRHEPTERRVRAMLDGETVIDSTRVLHPGIPFPAHSTAGEQLDVRAAATTLSAAAFRPADPDLAGYVVLDFKAFDSWYEEDEAVFSHPRDPFSRVDTRRSSRSIRIELDGVLLAESTRPTLLFETAMADEFRD